MFQYNHEQHHIGYYDTPQEAAQAYDRKAIQYLGNTAPTNFPISDYQGCSLGSPRRAPSPRYDSEEVRLAALWLGPILRHNPRRIFRHTHRVTFDSRAHSWA
jgi:hypothetical protein